MTASGKPVPLNRVQKVIASRMTAAWQAPAFPLTVEIDMESASKVKERESSATVTDALLMASVAALKAVPQVNAHFTEAGIAAFDEVGLGLAVATPKGLMVPVIRNAGAMNLGEMARARKDLVDRSRAGTLKVDDMTGGTFTVSNLGMMGVTRFGSILNAPQVAILSVGATLQRNVMRDGAPEWRPVAEVTLTCDHRALDGAIGADFLNAFKAGLESG